MPSVTITEMQAELVQACMDRAEQARRELEFVVCAVLAGHNVAAAGSVKLIRGTPSMVMYDDIQP